MGLSYMYKGIWCTGNMILHDWNSLLLFINLLSILQNAHGKTGADCTDWILLDVRLGKKILRNPDVHFCCGSQTNSISEVI